MDNRQLLIDVLTFDVKPAMIKESISNNGKVLVQGVIQRANTLNQNNRIYPKHLLVREVEKYMQLVKERRSLGELDHPECLRPSAQILTKSGGWKYFSDLNQNDEVCTLNLETNNIEYQKINKIINEKYKGIAYSIKGKNIDTVVTPNHRFVVVDRNGSKTIKTAEEIYNLSISTKYTHLMIPKTANWNGIDADFYTLKSAEDILGKIIRKDLREKYSKDLNIDSKIWFSFLGIYLAEGHVDKKGKSYRITITQKKEETKQLISELLDKFPKEIEWKKDFKKGKFYTNDARLYKYLSVLGNKYTKYIPDDIKQYSSSLLEELFNWFQLGDGDSTKYNNYVRNRIYSTSKRLIEDFNEVLLKIGGSGKIEERICKKDYTFAGRIIKKENKKPLYVLHVSPTNGIYLDFRFIEMKKIDYDDTVHCVSVPNETIYVRDGQHNSPFWSGNSSVINLANVSHLITDLKWQGDDLIGTVEVLPTPSGNILKALFESGVKVGISSRGLGSVKDKGNGAVEVQEDFELLCWDMVSNPSTKGSFMYPIGKMNEGIDKKLISESKNVLNKDFTRINEIILEIFSNLNFECGEKCELPSIKEIK